MFFKQLNRIFLVEYKELRFFFKVNLSSNKPKSETQNNKKSKQNAKNQSVRRKKKSIHPQTMIPKSTEMQHIEKNRHI